MLLDRLGGQGGVVAVVVATFHGENSHMLVPRARSDVVEALLHGRHTASIFLKCRFDRKGGRW